MRWTILAMVLLVAAAPAGEANATDSKPDQILVMENDFLKISVSPVGAKIISLVDKLHHRQEVKNLPYASGMNVIRFGAALNLDDQKDRYDLQLSKLADGTQRLVATATVQPTDEKPGAAVVTKEYVLSPGSSCVALSLQLHNTGHEEIGLIPWVWHLLNRGTKQDPEEAHMTPYGAFITERCLPEHRDQKIISGAHQLPASNWTSRVVLPVEDGSNTLATITRPQDMLKIYSWHRQLEDFCTQELIAAPMFAKPGNNCRFDYFLVLAAPVRNIVYCSPELVIGTSPHPTWLSSNDKELALDFSSTREMAGLKVHARLVAVGAEQTDLREYDFTLPKLSPQDASRQTIAVALKDGKNYQLRLDFVRDGQPYFPGAAASDRGDVIIPLIVGKQETVPVVFPDQTQRNNRLRHLQPQVRQEKQVYAGKDFDAFSYPSAQRCFREDRLEASGKGNLQLFACAGEYESLQLVLMPKGSSEAVYQVAGTTLAGPHDSQVTCESINDFIYVPTKMPSLYNALFPLGDYPEALLPTKQVRMAPGVNHPLFITYHVPRGTAPGVYHGSISLSQGAVRREIPVEMTVWNIELPLRSRWMEYASSLKGTNIPGAEHADGTPLTRKEQLDAIIDMHLKYRLTPCDTGFVNDLLAGNRQSFEKEMQKFVDGGATKIYFGRIPELLKNYSAKLPEIESYLEAKGWTDYFFVRPGFDEASSDLVPTIKAVCQQWKKISKIKIMETYYHDDPKELYGWLDIWARNFPVQPWMAERRAAGDVFWKVNAMPGTLEVEPWDQGRNRFIRLWDYHFTGSYNWTVKAWGNVKDWGTDYWCDNGVGNLAAVLMWPSENGILSTIRLEALRDGLEDNTMLWMLREKVDALAGKTPSDPAQAKALVDARSMCNSGPLSDGIHSAEDVERLHEKVGNTLSLLNSIP
jgi:hypothetical protein